MSQLLIVATFAAAAMIFAVDSLVPIGVAIAVLYTFIIFISSTFLDARGVVRVAMLCLLLTLGAFFIEHAGDYDAASTIRCVFSVVVILLTTLLSLQNQRSSEQTKQRELELQKVVDSIPGMVWSADAVSGNLEYTNAQCRDIGTLDEPVHSAWDRVVHPEDRARRASDWEAARASGLPFENIARYRHRNGAYRWMLARAAPFNGAGGQIVRWYGINTDIDDQRRAEGDLLRAQEDLSRVARVTTLGELAASIAHEVNQPLAAFVSNGEACLRWLAHKEPNIIEATRSVSSMIANARRAADVIARLRALSGKSRTKRALLDMASLIDDVLLVVGRELERKRIRLVRRQPAGGVAVMGDRIQLQQVLLNLVMNAIQAMDGAPSEDNELTLSTSRIDSDQGPIVVLEVADNADGPLPDDFGRLFDAFFTTKEGGLGMGLTICRSIVETHGGTIAAEPSAKCGMLFRVSLPAPIETRGRRPQ